MGVPNSPDARLFYRCAIRRDQESRLLLEHGHTTGAVYLSGYGVECMLKALALMSVSGAKRAEMLKSFRGNKAHDYEWLRTLYFINGGARFPREIVRYFTFVNGWSTDLTYDPGEVKEEDADAFLQAAEAILIWVKTRL